MTGPSPTVEAIRADTAALIAAEVQLSSDLLRLEADAPAAKQDIEAARRSISQEIGDLQGMASATSVTEALLALDAVVATRRAGGGAFVQLRSDFGLPPPSQLGPSPTPAAA